MMMQCHSYVGGQKSDLTGEFRASTVVVRPYINVDIAIHSLRSLDYQAPVVAGEQCSRRDSYRLIPRREHCQAVAHALGYAQVVVRGELRQLGGIEDDGSCTFRKLESRLLFTPEIARLKIHQFPVHREIGDEKGGGIKPPSVNTTAHRHLARQTAQMHPLSHFLAYLSLVEEKAAGIGVEMRIVDKAGEMNQVGSIFACLLIRLSRGMAVIFIRGIALSIRGIALR